MHSTHYTLYSLHSLYIAKGDTVLQKLAVQTSCVAGEMMAQSEWRTQEMMTLARKMAQCRREEQAKGAAEGDRKAEAEAIADGGDVAAIRYSTLCTILHTPCTIHHTPYTILHTPYSIHHTHTPYIIDCTPYTIHPNTYCTAISVDEWLRYIGWVVGKARLGKGGKEYWGWLVNEKEGQDLLHDKPRYCTAVHYCTHTLLYSHSTVLILRCSSQHGAGGDGEEGAEEGGAPESAYVKATKRAAERRMSRSQQQLDEGFGIKRRRSALRRKSSATVTLQVYI
jgi:hypothetical protein